MTALDIVVAVRGVPERLAWPETAVFEGPVAAVLADIEQPVERLPPFEAWAIRGWQPLVIVSLVSKPGSEQLFSELARLGFSLALYYSDRTEYWNDLQSTLETMLDRHLWLVPEFVKAMGTAALPVIGALAAAVGGQPDVRTVDRWAERSQIDGYRALYDLLVNRGLPPPKRLLTWIRLCWAVAYAREVPRLRSREEVARRLRYPNADYMGKRCKELVGVPFSRVAETGVPLVLDRFRATLRNHPLE